MKVATSHNRLEPRVAFAIARICLQDLPVTEAGSGGGSDSSRISRRRVKFLTRSIRWQTLILVVLTLALTGGLTACTAEQPSGTVSIDGSSTVYHSPRR
jgi:hypothetical protein